MLDTIADRGGESTDDVPLMHEAEDRDRAARAFRATVMPGREDELSIAIAHAAVSTWNTHQLARVLRAAESA